MVKLLKALDIETADRLEHSYTQEELLFSHAYLYCLCVFGRIWGHWKADFLFRSGDVASFSPELGLSDFLWQRTIELFSCDDWTVRIHVTQHRLLSLGREIFLVENEDLVGIEIAVLHTIDVVL